MKLYLMYRVIFALIIFIKSEESSLQAQNLDLDSCNKSINISCTNLIVVYSKYWKADSLAVNGFRDFFGTEVLSKCNCLIGIKWSELSNYFGKPNFKIDSDKFLQKSEVLFRYILYSSEDIKEYKKIGNKRLDVVVSNGKIVRFSVFEIDG